jgi:hypothetical protein
MSIQSSLFSPIHSEPADPFSATMKKVTSSSRGKNTSLNNEIQKLDSPNGDDRSSSSALKDEVGKRKASLKSAKRRFPQKIDRVKNQVSRTLQTLQKHSEFLETLTNENILKGSANKRSPLSPSSRLSGTTNGTPGSGNNCFFNIGNNFNKFKNPIRKIQSELGNVLKELEEMKLISEQVRASRRTGQTAPTGLEKMRTISRHLALFADWNPHVKKSRCQVTRFLCDYIRNQNLQIPDKKREFAVDKRLGELFTVPMNTRMTYPEIQQKLANLFAE